MEASTRKKLKWRLSLGFCSKLKLRIGRPKDSIIKIEDSSRGNDSIVKLKTQDEVTTNNMKFHL